MNSAAKSSSGKGDTGNAGKAANTGDTANASQAAGAAETGTTARAAKTSKAADTEKVANTADTGKVANTGKAGKTAAAKAAKAKTGKTGRTADTANAGKTGKAGKTADTANADKSAKAGAADTADSGKAGNAGKAGKSDAAKAGAADNTAKVTDIDKVAGAAGIADTADAGKTGTSDKAGDAADAGDTVKADSADNTAKDGDISKVTATAAKAGDAGKAGKSDITDAEKTGDAGKSGKSAAPDTSKTAKPANAGKGDVAVIVALGNAIDAAEILKCLESQTLQPKKTVFALAADAEQGRALQKLLDASKLPHTELLCDEKLRGEAGCWNAGAERAGECEFLYFLKAGYMPDSHFLQCAAERLHGNSAAVAASADYLREHEERQILESGAGPEQEGPLWLFQNGADLVPRTLFRGAAFRSFYGFNLEAGNARDFEFCLLIAKQGDWLYAADCAVRAVEDEYACSADADDERDRDYALLCEMYFDNFDFRGRIPKAVYRALFARKWHRAAQWMLAAGRLADARDCLRRSLAWKIVGNPALWRLMIMPAYKSALLQRRQETARSRLSAGQSPLPAPASRF